MLIGLILATHGKLAEGILDAGSMIVGETNGVEVVSLIQEVGIEEFSRLLEVKVQRMVQECTGVLILCDLQGGTPFNCSLRLAMKKEYQAKLKVVAGLNLPMYIETLLARNKKKLDELADVARESGKNGVQAF
jgi:mannose PTS system EIIA component